MAPSLHIGHMPNSKFASWIGKLQSRKVTSNPTPKNLREQVHCKPSKHQPHKGLQLSVPVVQLFDCKDILEPISLVSGETKSALWRAQCHFWPLGNIHMHPRTLFKSTTREEWHKHIWKSKPPTTSITILWSTDGEVHWHRASGGIQANIVDHQKGNITLASPRALDG